MYFRAAIFMVAIFTCGSGTFAKVVIMTACMTLSQEFWVNESTVVSKSTSLFALEVEEADRVAL